VRRNDGRAATPGWTLEPVAGELLDRRAMTNAGGRMPGMTRVGRGRLGHKLGDMVVSTAAVLVIGSLCGAVRVDSVAAGPAGGAAASPVDPAARELRRRNDELVKQGFTLTSSVTRGGAEPVRVELLIPPDDSKHTVALWLEVDHGDASLRWLGPSGEVVTDWHGRRLEQRTMRALAPGKHVIEIRAGGGLVHGLIGVKGAVIERCAIDAARVTEQPADPASGFAWPYVLVAPKARADGATTLLVVPPNTGFATEDLELLRASMTCAVNGQLALADRLGTAIIAPLFPRPVAPPPARNLYLHALSRASLETRDAKVARVDLQLIAMLDHAGKRLAAQGHHASPRVLITGFSASGSFTSRFAVLHPDRVLAAAVGSPGGWPLAPVASARGQALPYPVGIADVDALTGAPIDLAALRRVHFLFLLGDADANDAVPARDAYSAASEALVMRLFGKTPVARWDAARQLYDAAGLHAQFRLYRGVGHQMSPAMNADVEAMFRAALATP
jgi:dienelactone hydrolase